MAFQARVQNQPWTDVPDKSVARFCLEKCGGGWTIEQTAAAMEMQEGIYNGTPYHASSGLEIRRKDPA